jgi:hypothetical protein
MLYMFDRSDTMPVREGYDMGIAYISEAITELAVLFFAGFAVLTLAFAIIARQSIAREFRIMRMKKAKRLLIDQLILEIGRDKVRVKIEESSL